MITVLNTTDGPVLVDVLEGTIQFPPLNEEKMRPIKHRDFNRVIKKVKDCSLESILDFEHIFRKLFDKAPTIEVSEFSVTYRDVEYRSKKAEENLTSTNKLEKYYDEKRNK